MLKIYNLSYTRICLQLSSNQYFPLELNQEIDWIALSFVQKLKDVEEVKKYIGDKAGVIAKIEKPSALKELNEIIEDCKKLGAFIFNPHVLTVEGGGLGVVDADQVKAKLRFDPKGLLNPGKLEGWEVKEQFKI